VWRGGFSIRTVGVLLPYSCALSGDAPESVHGTAAHSPAHVAQAAPAVLTELADLEAEIDDLTALVEGIVLPGRRPELSHVRRESG